MHHFRMTQIMDADLVHSARESGVGFLLEFRKRVHKKSYGKVSSKIS